MINFINLPGYQLVDAERQTDDIHLRLEAPIPIACEECGVQGEFVRFGKRDVPYRDLPIPVAMVVGERNISGFDRVYFTLSGIQGG